MKTTLAICVLTFAATSVSAQSDIIGSVENPVPLCSKTVTDNCMNPSQAPRNYPKVKAGTKEPKKQRASSKK